jgi:Flp pilus assembly protein TadG
MEIQSVPDGRTRGAIVVRLFRPRTKIGNACNAAIVGLHADRRGATAFFTAIIIVSLIGAVGVAVDGTRLVMVKSRLKTAIDAAALVAARDITLAESRTHATNLFWANFGRSSATSTLGYLGTQITKVAVTDVAADTVSVVAEGLFPMTFMQILGISSMPIASSAQAIRAATGLEIALALDNTGSMAGWPIASVITSATELVNILYGNGSKETEQNLWISVVPFSAEVNIGTNRSAWLKPGSNSAGAYMNTAWMGCVMARYDTVDAATGRTNDFTDVPPGAAPFTPFLYPSTAGLYTKTAGKKVISFGDNDWTPGTITESRQSTIAQNTAVGPNLGCPQNRAGGGLAILPETASRTTVLNQINEMVANFRGGTFINLGLQAGWWTISPRWRGAAGWGDATLPLNYGTPYMKKVIVLMTDGNNTWFDYPDRAPGACYASSSSPSGNCPVPNWTGDLSENDGNTDFTAYGRLLSNTMNLPAGQNTQANATANLDAKMSQLCTIIKQTGTIIYTILFNHNGSVTNSTKTLFQNCATTPQHYFLDATADELRASFSKIGGQLASLRISQ